MCPWPKVPLKTEITVSAKSTVLSGSSVEGPTAKFTRCLLAAFSSLWAVGLSLSSLFAVVWMLPVPRHLDLSNSEARFVGAVKRGGQGQRIPAKQKPQAFKLISEVTPTTLQVQRSCPPGPVQGERPPGYSHEGVGIMAALSEGFTPQCAKPVCPTELVIKMQIALIGVEKQISELKLLCVLTLQVESD